ncbi:MAG: class I SAM-dependent methyltransferase [Acidimicrobiales bacterium]
MEDYLECNRANWDERAPAHAASPDYAVERFERDPRFLSGVVRFDLPRLGDLSRIDAVHLQCHIGTDTISLARLGARVTGVDFSPASLVQARRLARATATPLRLVESELYSAPEALAGERFDLVYTGVGALCWLPDVDRWAEVVAALLRPGGRLFIREGHPMLASIDESHTEDLVVDYPYFERPEPMVFDDPGTYVETDATFVANRTHEWSHGLGQVVTAVLDAGMILTGLTEHDSVPWEAVPGQMSRDEHGEWRLTERPWRLAASYTLQALRT